MGSFWFNNTNHTEETNLSQCSSTKLGCPAEKCHTFNEETCGPMSYISVLAGIALLAVLINVFHIIILRRSPGLVSKNHGFSVLCLAVIDIITALMVVTVSNCPIQRLMRGYQILCSSSLLFNGLPPIGSALVLLVISIDRLQAVRSTHIMGRSSDSPQNWFQKHFRAILGMMITTSLLVFVAIFILDHKKAQASGTLVYPCHTGFTMCMLQGETVYTAGFATPLFVMTPVLISCVCYCFIGGSLVQRANQGGVQAVRGRGRLKASIASIGLLILTFFMSYLPIVISLILRLRGYTTTQTVHLVTTLLFFSSALLNPFVYFASNRQYRKTIFTSYEELSGSTLRRAHGHGSRTYPISPPAQAGSEKKAQEMSPGTCDTSSSAAGPSNCSANTTDTSAATK